MNSNKTKRLARRYDKSNPEDSSNVILIKLENGKRYVHTALERYRITMASLQPDERKQPNCACDQMNKLKKDRDQVVLIVESNLKEHILCILDIKKQRQAKLNLLVEPGEQIAFRTIGCCPVQLIGYSGAALL